MRNLVLINEPIYRDSVEEFVTEFSRAGLQPSSISPSYGLAENCTYVSTAWRGRSSGGGFPSMPSHNKLLPSARLRDADVEEDEMQIMVVNEETCEAVEDGVEGEIWVSSPSNACGYLGCPSLTLEVFEARLRGTARRFVRTGDRGVVRGEERYLFVTGRVADVVKVKSGEVEVELHPHQLEMAAYNSYRSHLRGGCIAALGISESEVAVVAELQQSKKEKGGGEEEDKRAVQYGSICGGMREAVRREMSGRIGTEAGLGVVLVESGSLPKTTSGKLQRWAAKGKLMRGDMKVVFDDRGRDHANNRNAEKEDEKKTRKLCRRRDRLGLMSML